VPELTDEQYKLRQIIELLYSENQQLAKALLKWLKLQVSYSFIAAEIRQLFLYL
jgi:tRNA A37 N6-isopentenylltransferase MiaA